MAGTATAHTARATAWRDVDLAAVKLADGKDGFKRSWIMLMPEGEFEHPQYGKLEFTRAKLAEFKRNFDGKVRKIDIALDQDHDGGKATGWLEQLQLRAGGLYGLVRWTSLGAQLLSDQIYRYFSPEFGKFTDPESGKVFPNVIIGGALTNRPFLKNMPAVHLKERFQKPGQYTKSDREKIGDEDFAGPNRTFPIVTQQDVHDAARLVGHAANPATVKARITAIAKRKGFSLPAAWADESSSAASERMMARVATRKRTKLAEQEPADDQEQEIDLDSDVDDEQMTHSEEETEDALDVLGDDGADTEELDEADEGDDDEGQTFADKPPFKGAAKPFGKGGKKPTASADDAEDEDEADGGADEDAEELDDMTSDDEEYDEASADGEDDGEEEEAPAPKGRGKGKGMPTATKKMTEPQLLAENRRLREENQTLREEQFKLGVARKLSEITRNIRKDGEDEEFALPRSLKLAYQDFMFKHGIRLSEGALTKLNDLVEKALRVGTVPLTSFANQVESGRVVDADDRRPRTSFTSVDQTDEAEKIALSEFKMPLSELARKDPAKAESIYLRLEQGRMRKGRPAA